MRHVSHIPSQLSYNIYDSYVEAILNFSIPSGEVIVPPVFEDKPVTTFYLGTVRSGINRVKLPASIEEFNFHSWLGYSVNIEVDENNPHFFSDGKAVYTKDRSKLIFFLARDDEEYTILPECRTIGNNAFERSKKLKKIVFPSGLTSIGDYAFCCCETLSGSELPDGLINIGIFAFDGVQCAYTVNLPKTVETLGGMAFPENWTIISDKENPHLIYHDGFYLSHGGKRIEYCTKASENGLIIIPEQITAIGPAVFYGRENIRRVILPKGLHTIGAHAFEKAVNLKEIDFENVREIGEAAFAECASLEKISLKCDSIGKEAFQKCSNLIETEVDCEKIPENMFFDCEKLRKVIFMNTKVIGEFSFHSAYSLKEVDLPHGLEIIEEYAFAHCGLKRVTLPKTVKQVGECCLHTVREIHIYDSIETVLSPNNDISEYNYNLYVHSAETDEIKYVVPVFGNEDRKYYDENWHGCIVGMFRSGLDFDFKEFDDFYLDTFDDDFFTREKINAGKLRLKYGYELDEKTRREYEKKLGELPLLIVEEYLTKYEQFVIPDPELFDRKGLEALLEPELYAYVNAGQLLPFIDRSAKYNITELTAFLMKICDEKRTKPQKSG